MLSWLNVPAPFWHIFTVGTSNEPRRNDFFASMTVRWKVWLTERPIYFSLPKPNHILVIHNIVATVHHVVRKMVLYMTCVLGYLRSKCNRSEIWVPLFRFNFDWSPPVRFFRGLVEIALVLYSYKTMTYWFARLGMWRETVRFGRRIFCLWLWWWEIVHWFFHCVVPGLVFGLACCVWCRPLSGVPGAVLVVHTFFRV
jgi:hypothetical protein